MNNVAGRLNKIMSYSEIKLIKVLIEEMSGEIEKDIINSKIADSVGTTRSVLVNAIRLLEAAGVIEARSMGMKGTHIKVLDQETFQAIANF